jgi:adenine deaminase
VKTPNQISGTIVCPVRRRQFKGIIGIQNGRISGVEAREDVDAGFILPGFVDAHVHIESSMLVPSTFARLAVRHGTVATVSDPHEIANVLGVEGVDYMLRDAARTPLIVAFGAPSCVPATPFETAGAVMGVEEVTALLDDPRIGYLSEMMNYPGVVHGDPGVMAKIRASLDRGKPVDGHSPLLRGPDLETYVAAGISTDHECTSEAEAVEKLELGMLIAIREGSAARNFDALIGILKSHPGRIMFCSDDKHPDELVAGHIDRLVARSVGLGHDLWDVLEAACVTPVRHYNLDVGLLQVGDRADFIRVEDLADFRVKETYIGGSQVACCGKETFFVSPADPINRFVRPAVTRGDFALRAEGARIRVIRAIDGALVTGSEIRDACVEDGMAVADPARDLLKMAVVNRYTPAPPAVAFIEGFGLKRGAIASSVGHDSHNIIAVGADDESLMRAVDAVGSLGGGIAVVDAEDQMVMGLEVAGLMSTRDGEEVATAYERLDRRAKELGSGLRAPFMTLSFMALLVIPSLKLGDRGLFDVEQFDFVSLFVE